MGEEALGQARPPSQLQHAPMEVEHQSISHNHRHEAVKPRHHSQSQLTLRN